MVQILLFRRVLIIIILPTIPLHSWYNLFLPPLFPASHSVGTNVISVYQRLSPKLPHGCALIEAIFCQMRFLCLFSSVLPSLLQHIKNIACRFQTKLLWQRQKKKISTDVTYIIHSSSNGAGSATAKGTFNYIQDLEENVSH